MGELWCVRILEPDDVHAAPSREQAEQTAAAWNTIYQSDGLSLTLAAELWPWSPESHAESLVDWISLDDIKATAQDIIRLRETRQ